MCNSGVTATYAFLKYSVGHLVKRNWMTMMTRTLPSLEPSAALPPASLHIGDGAGAQGCGWPWRLLKICCCAEYSSLKKECASPAENVC